MNWFANKLGPLPGEQQRNAERAARAANAKSGLEQQQTARAAPPPSQSKAAPPPKPEKEKKKGWF